MGALGSLDGDLGFAVRANLGRRRGGLVVAVAQRIDAIHSAHEQEDDESHDQEIDDGGEEGAVIEGGGAGFLGGGEGGVSRTVKRDEPVGEIDAAGDKGNDRHDQVGNKGIDDGFESGADDHADCHIDHITAVDKISELFEKLLHFFVSFILFGYTRSIAHNFRNEKGDFRFLFDVL